MSSSGGKVFTLEEVAKHTSKDDCWLVIGGKVVASPLSPVLLLSPVPRDPAAAWVSCFLFLGISAARALPRPPPHPPTLRLD
uniref:Cytochrome b5 heme-binding domain-containing protein n=1 Tax=Aegilops tauschii subsp. strangulata TaxID=200361 RepID=A0A453GW06_AEGTS